MFSVEIRINSQLIGHIKGKRVTPIELEMLADESDSEYEYEYYDVESGVLVHGTVTHRRKDKIRRLINLILADAEKRLE